MELQDFTVVDGAVAVIVLISALLAFSRGLIREVMSILGWVVAAVAAFTFAPQVEPMVKEIPILKDLIGSSCELSILAAFAAVFAVALVIVSIFTPLFSGMVANSALGPMDQGLGFLFGVARGAILVAIAFIVYERVIVSDPIPMVDDSRTAVVFAQVSEAIDEQIPADAPGWVADQYDALIGKCSANSDA